jgi:signal transduction histidine kinase/CheY-like chemotaxis protein
MPETRTEGSAAQRGHSASADVEYLLSHFPGAVSVYDAGLNLLAANDQHYELTGVPKAGFGPGSTYEAIVRFIADSGGYGPEIDIEALVRDRMKAVRQPHWRFERVQNGRYIAGYTAVTPSGGVICCQQDVTEEKEAQQRLVALTKELAAARDLAEAANRAKSEFLAMMSHEIRTPLNGILGMSELMHARAADPTQKQHLDVVLKSGQALLSIINDVLDLARIDAGRMQLESAPFDLRDLVEDVATLLATRIERNLVDVAIRYNPALPDAIVGDASRVRQILTNLIGNAVKFTREGHILIEVDGAMKQGRAVLTISVTDTGIGVKADRLDSIFERFEQADFGSTRRYGGAGLGLAICRLLVDAMGGKIGVESEFGAGSRFWFTLEAPVAPAAVVTMPDLGGVRVLALDDVEASRTAVRGPLEHCGAMVQTASDVMEATALVLYANANDAPFDLIIADAHLPGLEELLEGPASRRPAILGLTPVAAGRLPAERAAHYVNLVQKPVRRDALLDAVSTALGLDRAARRTAARA